MTGTPAKQTNHQSSTSFQNVSIFTPSGFLTRFSQQLDHVIKSLDETCSGSTVVYGLYSIILGFPLKICKTGVMKLERLLGIKHRTIITAARHQKVTGSEGMGGNGFDLSNSPVGKLSPKSPKKRDFEDLEDTEMNQSCESSAAGGNDVSMEGSTDPESEEGVNLLDVSESYRSEDDPDYQPPPTHLNEDGGVKSDADSSRSEDGSDQSDMENEEVVTREQSTACCEKLRPLMELHFAESEEKVEIAEAKIQHVPEENPPVVSPMGEGLGYTSRENLTQKQVAGLDDLIEKVADGDVMMCESYNGENENYAPASH